MIERDGRIVTTRWGRIGAEGSSRSRELPDVEGAKGYIDKAVAQRLAQGFVRIDAMDVERRSDVEAHLRDNPDDVEAALVYADLLMGQDDPRGELIVLEHALKTNPTRELQDRADELVQRHWKYFAGKPGGFPLQSAWLGRSFLYYESPEPQKARGRGGLPLFRRVRAFLEACTDCVGPDEVVVENRGGAHYAIYEYNRHGRFPLTWTSRLRRDWLRDLHQTLPPGGWDKRGRWSGVSIPKTSVLPAIEEFVTRWEDRGARMAWQPTFRFQLARDGLPLPFQSAAWYAGTEDDLDCTLRVDLDTRDIHLVFRVPIEDFGPAFEAWYDEAVGHLGKVFARRFWYRATPKVGGTGMKLKKEGFSR